MKKAAVAALMVASLAVLAAPVQAGCSAAQTCQFGPPVSCNGSSTCNVGATWVQCDSESVKESPGECSLSEVWGAEGLSALCP